LHARGCWFLRFHAEVFFWEIFHVGFLRETIEGNTPTKRRQRRGRLVQKEKGLSLSFCYNNLSLFWLNWVGFLKK
jgi:hypothetical protein